MVCIHVLDDPLLGCRILCLWCSHSANPSGFRYRDKSGAVSDVVLIDWSEVSCGVTSVQMRLSSGRRKTTPRSTRDARENLHLISPIQRSLV